MDVDPVADSFPACAEPSPTLQAPAEPVASAAARAFGSQARTHFPEGEGLNAPPASRDTGLNVDPS